LEVTLISQSVYDAFYSGIDHELEKIQKAAPVDLLTNRVNAGHDSEFPVDRDQQGDEVSTQLDMQLDKLNLTKDIAGQQCYLVSNMFCVHLR